MMYLDLVLYLKGIHLTLDSWRANRNSKGWKIKSDSEWSKLCNLVAVGRDKSTDSIWQKNQLINSHECAPLTVTGVDRLGNDLNALEKLLQGKSPSKRLIRGQGRAEVIYGFGDASGLGFGATWCQARCSKKIVNEIGFRIGVWLEDTQDKSSNYRELANLVETLESMGSKGELKGREVFFFTDNSTCELAHHKGNSTSELLFELVLRLRCLSMRFQMKLHFIHVAGTRMIEQGTDDLSRGELTSGVMKGTPMLAFVPLHLTAIDRWGKLGEWIKSWLGQEATLLSPEGWFQEGHDIVDWQRDSSGMDYPVEREGKWIWTPPPGAADVAVYQLRLARLKRQRSTHVFVCPKLFLPHWRRSIHKVADIVLECAAGQNYWPSTMHEPLVICICFPFLSQPPWQLKGSPVFYDIERMLRGVWKNKEKRATNILRSFCASVWKLQRVEERRLSFLLHASATDFLAFRRNRKRTLDDMSGSSPHPLLSA